MYTFNSIYYVHMVSSNHALKWRSLVYYLSISLFSYKAGEGGLFHDVYKYGRHWTNPFDAADLLRSLTKPNNNSTTFRYKSLVWNIQNTTNLYNQFGVKYKNRRFGRNLFVTFRPSISVAIVTSIKTQLYIRLCNYAGWKPRVAGGTFLR